MTVRFLKNHIVAIETGSDRWVTQEDKIEYYLNKLSDEKVEQFCAKIRAINKALKLTGDLLVYDSGAEYSYSGVLEASNFGIEWKKKKLCIIS